MASIKREKAMICMIDDLLQGSFVRTEGWNPSYFSTEMGDVSRANIMGVVVNKEPNGGVLLDDGSGRILLRSFEENAFAGVDTGDLVLVIGRPRIYNEQKYVLPEIIKKVDHKWGEYRRLQLELLRKRVKRVKKAVAVSIKEAVPPVNYFQKILEFIKDLDSGSGADAEEVIKRSGAPDADALIRKLIEEGEIFELKPGKLKILE
jgi:RPA family protein